MARLARNLNPKAGGLFHIRACVAGFIGDFPLQKPENARQLAALIHRFTSLYSCSVGSFNILGSHYHLVLRFQAYRKLSRDRLWKTAQRFYPDPRYQPHQRWNDCQWEQFNRRLFNVSELMRNLQSTYARWYNRRYNRRGRFWADRFQLTESNNLLETVFYVDLNAVRAGLVIRPENWCFSSAWLRRHKRDDWLTPIEDLTGVSDRRESERLYWGLLYWRGTKPSKANDRRIPIELAERMEREGIDRGCYLKSIPHFTRGVVVADEEHVKQILAHYRSRGVYNRDRSPVPLGVANLYALR